jgi:ABC-2 type transport system ATP-binding protein
MLNFGLTVYQKKIRMSIKVESLTKTYGQQMAVDSISFELKIGEIVGFIGPNGSGKSTTMKCICGVIPPDSGNIEVGGINVQKELLKVKKIIGYLPENNPLYHDMYVKEYLLHIAGYYPESIKHRNLVNNIVAVTGLAPEQHKKIGQLSKGYKQRVGLAQVMIHDPEVLILDEPTSGLDPNQIVEIRNLISGLAKDKTVLLSTHILQEVEAICDRIIIINEGKIVADDTALHIRSAEKSNLQTVYIEFSTPVNKEILLGIEGIIKVEALSENEFLLAGKTEVDLRERIFNFAMENRLKLLTIQRKEETLEQAFRKLTK